jgi:ABC-type Fe3+-siderophore transport system permease subunit
LRLTSNPTKEPVFLIIFLLLLLNIAIIAGNIFFASIPPIRILFCVLGSFYYLLLLKLKTSHPSHTVEYLNSGEACICALSLLIIFRFITEDPVILFFLSVVPVIFFEIYIHYILKLKNRELLYIGLILNLLLVIFMLFFVIFDAAFNAESIWQILIGYGNLHLKQLPAFFILLIIGLIFNILMIILSSKIRLLSQGEYYFNNAGYIYKYSRLALLCLKGIFISIMFFLLGWIGGIGIIINNRRHKIRFTNDIAVFLICIFYTQFLLFLSAWIHVLGVILLSLLFSGASYFYKKQKGILHHDRAY